VKVKGPRNPRKQPGGLQPGLVRAVLDRDEGGNLVRKAGVPAVALTGGGVRPGDGVRVEPPPGHHLPLETVSSGRISSPPGRRRQGEAAVA